ncbi:bifunctional 2-polyprenyl-6-hydroxyphenol methylase/3-demethylubiquinol 3-O-methyltransferase UbiG [Thermodesulfobacterium sp.]|uniref:class I SAM-dependent methyltransferase n=1 Tax=Thermodesulfobacterium sp. TaxID=1965289 RepID=UPI0026493F65|nr:class I SAM-dependent methyltransferase [Thermodesulfobacterium sp.]MDN5380187.1 hypothetical protein [Thermodesulfobacterium sp.]
MKTETFCPICEEKVSVDDYREVYVSPYTKQEYKRYEWPNCDVHWWEPLKIIPEFYESEVFEDYIAFHEGVSLSLGDNHKAFFRYFPLRAGKLLDIGCGDGRFIRHAKEAGFEVWGIDFDTKSVETVKRELGIDTVFAMSLEEFYEFAKKEGLKFDVITFFEVLEHQDKPKEFLKMVKDLLKDGGYIAGSVPDRESMFQRTFYQKWYSYVDHPPHHFLRFSKGSLESALKLAGFSEVKVIKSDFPFKELFPYVEKKLFGNLDELKNKLKAMVVGSERKARAYAVEDLDKISERKKTAIMLKALKLGRNLALSPFVLLYLGKLKGNGVHLYFQARI